PQILIVIGSKSDEEQVRPCGVVLSDCGISYQARVLSAHRTPQEVTRLAAQAAGKGVRIIIAAAGAAAHLAGVIAAHTDLPVIGIPVESKSLKGLDSLLSTVQMPPGIPVATVAIGPMGAKNAAYLAVRILALSDARLATRLKRLKESMRREILKQKVDI
ncbi:MAG: 5-(carboxyamino)imidazole ribonucleotide mutase, partial [Candidatus Omnitrophica bacterium]|nr:5-(carboxyamino)imidazole ribonucleotide mutase [Candidatus Omnitrophota bacterium]